MKIKVLNGEGQLEASFDFGDSGEVLIGRGADCQIPLRDSLCSRIHAKLHVRNGQWLLKDMGSRNGTQLNGTAVTEAPVFEADRIALGASVLVVTGISPRTVGTTASLHFRDIAHSVLMSLPHEEADILTGKLPAETVEEIMHQNKVLREVCRISQLIGMKAAVDTILTAILNDMQDVLAADTVCLLMRSPDGQDWVVRAAGGEVTRDGSLNVSRTIIQNALQEGKAILSADPLSDDRFDASKSIVSQGVSSALCSPLKIGSGFGGVLFLDRRRRKAAFDQMDLRLTATVASILGVLLEKDQYEKESCEKARLATIGEVVAGIAHNIKNIVTGFNLSVNNLETALARGKTEMMAPCLRTIASLEHRISDLMLNMLSYSKDRELTPALLDARKLVGELVEPYTSQLAEKGIQFQFECAPGAEQVYAEDRALQRILLNLLLNSIDALESRKDGGEKRIRIAVSGGGAKPTEIRVRDSGTGIPKDTVDKIFDPFFSTKGSRGTGLGLAAVQKLVGEHHGKIGVASQEGAWTEFTIEIPPAPAATAPS